MKTVNLSFDFDGEGGWEASSFIHDDGCSFVWRIHVCDDGSFDVSDSDSELVGVHRLPTFATLADAKGYCEQKESEMAEASRHEQV